MLLHLRKDNHHMQMVLRLVSSVGMDPTYALLTAN